MANCECAAAISAEMKDWVKLGGSNSGCCGNAAHTYGFHCPGSGVPVTDYSRRHEAGRPYNMSWACAGDFSHGHNAKLRAMHATALGRLMNGELPMICEFIGKPWPDKPVYYWARWNGIKTLQRYKGRGHDHWSHISWWRSRANERAHLWVPASAPAPAPEKAVVKPAKVAPKYPGYLMKRKNKYDANVKIFQNQLRSLGGFSSVKADGIFGPITESAVRRFQKAHRLGIDGIIGPKTWKMAWTAAR